MQFNEKIQYILDKERWTQVDLANKTGIHIKTINQWMKRETAPKSQKLSKISSVTVYNIEWLKNDNYDGPTLEKHRWKFEELK